MLWRRINGDDEIEEIEEGERPVKGEKGKFVGREKEAKMEDKQEVEEAGKQQQQQQQQQERRRVFGKTHLFTADGAFDCSANPEEQVLSTMSRCTCVCVCVFLSVASAVCVSATHARAQAHTHTHTPQNTKHKYKTQNTTPT